MKSVLDFLTTNQTFIKAVDSDHMISIIMKTTGEQLRETLVNKLKADQYSGHTLIASPELTAEIFIGSMNQVSRWWLHHQKDITVSELLEQLKPFIQNLLTRKQISVKLVDEETS